MIRTTIQRRQAFTLVELMVVIAIIAVLVALLVPAITRAIFFAKQSTARTEISQLETAIQNFQSKYGVDYVPSRIKLCKWSVDYSTTTQLDIDSKAYLLKLFPKLTTGSGNAAASPPATFGAWATDSTGTPYATGTTPTFSNQSGVNWISDATFTSVLAHSTTTANPTVILEGHQCIVFFLGGIENTGTLKGCTGFSSNPLNPGPINPVNLATITTTPPANNPVFFEFSANRLVNVSFASTNPNYISTTTNNFLSYNDAVGNPPQPYAYFSSYKNTNGYNRYVSSNIIPDNYALQTSAPYPTNPGVALPIQPYATSIVVVTSGTTPAPGTISTWTFYKPDTFQILCAGKDGRWGLPPVDPKGTALTTLYGITQEPGLTASVPPAGNYLANGPSPYGLWMPTGGGTTLDGMDDLTNFTPGPVGAGQ